MVKERTVKLLIIKICAEGINIKYLYVRFVVAAVFVLSIGSEIYSDTSLEKRYLKISEESIKFGNSKYH